MNTRRLVAEHGGFLYDSDYYGDELPFYVKVEGQPASRRALFPGEQRRKVRRLDGHLRPVVLLRPRRLRHAVATKGRRGRPKMMSIGLHMRLIGHPARAMGLQRLLDHIASRRDVWVARRVDIARHWLEVHPAGGGLKPRCTACEACPTTLSPRGSTLAPTCWPAAGREPRCAGRHARLLRRG